MDLIDIKTLDTALVLQSIQVSYIVIFGQAEQRKSSLYCDSL